MKKFLLLSICGGFLAINLPSQGHCEFYVGEGISYQHMSNNLKVQVFDNEGTENEENSGNCKQKHSKLGASIFAGAMAYCNNFAIGLEGGFDFGGSKHEKTYSEGERNDADYAYTKFGSVTPWLVGQIGYKFGNFVSTLRAGLRYVNNKTTITVDKYSDNAQDCGVFKVHKAVPTLGIGFKYRPCDH